MNWIKKIFTKNKEGEQTIEEVSEQPKKEPITPMTLQKKYNLTERQMFETFRKMRVMEIVISEKPATFVHDPFVFEGSLLWEYNILSERGYIFFRTENKMIMLRGRKSVINTEYFDMLFIFDIKDALDKMNKTKKFELLEVEKIDAETVIIKICFYDIYTFNIYIKNQDKLEVLPNWLDQSVRSTKILNGALSADEFNLKNFKIAINNIDELCNLLIEDKFIEKYNLAYGGK